MKFRTICVIILLVLLCVVAIVSANSRYDFEEASYTVQKGDCLWYIANDYCPDGMDKQEYIQLIRERNNLDGSIIYPGQKLIVLVVSED